MASSKARSHDENRKLICCICYSESGQKAKRNVSSNQELIINDFVSNNFPLLNPCYPVGICTKCHGKLHRVKGGESLSILPVSDHFGSKVPPLLSNIKLLLLKDFNLTGDLKIINIECGIGTHSSMFPCPFCLTFKDKNGSGFKLSLELGKA